MRIGFIGVGVMGNGMVKNLLSHGYEVNVYTRTRAKALEALEAGYPLDMATGGLRAAWRALGEVTGGTVDEDVIDRIFEKFCLGK